MQETILAIMGKYGYVGVFLLIAIENIFPPIPSEVILLFGGFMTTYTTLNILGMTGAATLGSIAGAIALYCVGRLFNKDRLERMMEGRVGKVLRLKPDDIENAYHWFDTKGNKTVFFCRFIPLIRSLISIPAGMSRMRMPKFLTYTMIGSLIWNLVLIIAGSVVGANWESILAIMDTYSHVTVVVLAIAFVAGVIWFYRSRAKKKSAEDAR